MRRQPRPTVSGVSFPSPATTLGSRAIISKRNNRPRNRPQHNQTTTIHNQVRTRTRSSSSRLVAAHQRPSASSSPRFYSALSSLIESAAEESRDTVIMASQSFAVPWHRIKLWIEAQENLESQGIKPNLTKTQLSALSLLVSFVETEPDIGNHDYVSLLMNHIQHHRKKNSSLFAPTYQDVGLDVPINGNFHMRWRTTCSLPSASHLVFPCEGHGIPRGEQAPSFATKKASKQYAAKHALEYLQTATAAAAATATAAATAAAANTAAANTAAANTAAANTAAANTAAATTAAATTTTTAAAAAATPAPTSSPAAGSVSIKQATPPKPESSEESDSSVNVEPFSSLAIPPGDAGAPLVLSPPPPPPPPPPSTEMTAMNTPLAETSEIVILNGELYSGEIPSILQMVTDEANCLSFGCPKYEIVPDPERPGCWAGKAVFRAGGRIPDDIAVVKGAISRNSAKMLIAEKLHEYLKMELDRRQGLIDSFNATP